MDQVPFAKATEILWAYQDMFGSLVPLMGGLHTLCNFMLTIDKLFECVGLWDQTFDSGVITEESVTKVLGGHQYNRVSVFTS